jgi:hypothetical protein
VLQLEGGDSKNRKYLETRRRTYDPIQNSNAPRCLQISELSLMYYSDHQDAVSVDRRKLCSWKGIKLIRLCVALRAQQNVSYKFSTIFKSLLINTLIQDPAFNVTHFESMITRLLYTARNTAEHG